MSSHLSVVADGELRDPGKLPAAVAYERGRAEVLFGYSTVIGGRHTAREAREAVASWSAAAGQHEHTSYYGAAHVRAMRAYWLGVFRTARHLERERFGVMPARAGRC